jgi:hypothetical protein
MVYFLAPVCRKPVLKVTTFERARASLSLREVAVGGELPTTWLNRKEYSLHLDLGDIHLPNSRLCVHCSVLPLFRGGEQGEDVIAVLGPQQRTELGGGLLLAVAQVCVCTRP